LRAISLKVLNEMNENSWRGKLAVRCGVAKHTLRDLSRFGSSFCLRMFSVRARKWGCYADRLYV